MHRRKPHLPDYVPIGTTYVVEGKSNAKGVLRVSARYVVFPNGRRIDLPAAAVTTQPLAPRQAIGKRRAGQRSVTRARPRRAAPARANA